MILSCNCWWYSRISFYKMDFSITNYYCWNFGFKCCCHNMNSLLI